LKRAGAHLKDTVMSQQRTGPLAGVRIIEFAGIGPVPFAAMLLADMGADVVRVTRPGAPALDKRAIVERGRRVVELDLKSPPGVESALGLIDHADALLGGFRPGVMERLGVGPEPTLWRNPRLIYGRMIGWSGNRDQATIFSHASRARNTSIGSTGK
jgi:alpha-methylacyl-CoA racemase